MELSSSYMDVIIFSLSGQLFSIVLDRVSDEARKNKKTKTKMGISGSNQ